VKSVLLAASAFVVSCPALAETLAIADETPGLIASYGLSDFEVYAPRTALDMVLRVPGFTIQNDSSGERGFGQASGNVLINGQRISGKSNSVSDVLGRIPAASVERIEVREGATLDIPGLTGQVVNVISESNALSGAITWRSRFRENLTPFYDNIETSLSSSIGDLQWTVGLVSSPNRGANRGREDVFDGTGNQIAYREEDYNFTADNVSGTLGLNWTPANGHIGNLNGKYRVWQSNETEYSNSYFASGDAPLYRRFGFSEDEIETEIGADYEFDLGPGRLKLIGLNRYEDSPFNTTIYFTDLDTGEQIDATRYRRTVEEGETIFRGEYGWSTKAGADWQVSLEGAFNYLDNEALLYTQNMGEVFLPVAGSEYQVRVEEKRAEGFVSWSRPLTKKLGLQVSLGAEQSEISQPGADRDAQSFTRPKGEISLAYAHSKTIDITTTLKREVGQLDFYDFVSTVNLSEGNESTGNPEIVPQQSWELEIETEAGFGAYGAGTLTLYGAAIEDIVDQVPFGPDNEGPGNLDSAIRYGVELDATLKLAPYGFKGAEITFSGELSESSVDDPLTGKSRRISDSLTQFFEVEFRHDVPGTDWAWGVFAESYRYSPYYRLDQVSIGKDQPAYAHVYLEHKNLKGLTGTLFLGNILDQDNTYRREVYAPRRTGNLVLVEDRTRNYGHILTLRLKGAF